MGKGCIVIGAAMLDIVMEIDRIPKSGTDVYAKGQSMMVGGCAYNVADILKHFGVNYTLFAPIGTGMYADFIRKELKKAGHESPVHCENSDNGYCLCMVEADGERTFLTVPGIECHFQEEWFSSLAVDSYDSVYVSGYELEGDGGDAILNFLESNALVSSKQATVVDTIGAGDSHIGSVIAMRTMGHSFLEAISTANRIAAKVVSVKGPIITTEEFENAKQDET